MRQNYTYHLGPGGYKARANDFDIPEHHARVYQKSSSRAIS